jgi:Tfp pilus assembly protein PilX
MLQKRRRRRRDAGFSLLVVFMLIAAMVGLSAGAVLTTQKELHVAASDREGRLALGAAEVAVAQGKAWLASRSYDPTTGWTALLTDPTAANYLCAPVTGGATPGTTPKTANVATDLQMAPDGSVLSRWQFCVHNNADDPAYLDVSHNSPAGAPRGDVDDSRDPKHQLTVEAFGYGPNQAAVHLRVTVQAPTLSTTSSSNAYAQEGGGAQHLGAVASAENGVSVGTGSVSF